MKGSLHWVCCELAWSSGIVLSHNETERDGLRRAVCSCCGCEHSGSDCYSTLHMKCTRTEKNESEKIVHFDCHFEISFGDVSFRVTGRAFFIVVQGVVTVIIVLIFVWRTILLFRIYKR